MTESAPFTLAKIEEHWTQWAVAHGTSLRATTKNRTAKELEVDALARAMTRHGVPAGASVLEVGCGNGLNCLELARRHAGWRLDGFDFIAEMVAAAEENRRDSPCPERLSFRRGNVLELDRIEGLRPAYDAVFTDRCLINLNTAELQTRAISAIAKRVRSGGLLLMIENSIQTYAAQNRCREMVGLAPRTPDPYNLFFDEPKILPHLATIGLELLEIEDFISLHDLVLYVLVPAINGGHVDYEHPLVAAATKLTRAVSAEQPSAFGRFGQNRLYVCRAGGK
ncbi:MAG: class I SAM-dependent methyltransferase [Pseudomonadota bacterium]